MKISSIALVAGVVLLCACSKDEDCSNLSTNIIGTWELSFDEVLVEFKSDGRLVDTNDAIIGGQVNGTSLSEKTYSVDDETITVRAESVEGNQFVETSFDVTESNCNEISIAFLGFPAKLKRAN